MRMGKILAGAFLVGLLGFVPMANAQTITRLCTRISSTATGVTIYSCPDVGTSNPLPVTSQPISSSQTPLLNGSGSVTGTSAVTVFNAPGAGKSIYITGAQFTNSGTIAGQGKIIASTGASVLTTVSTPASPTAGATLLFPIPLVASGNVSVGCVWTGASTTNTCSLQGYTGP